MKTFSGLVAAVLLCVTFAGASARAAGGSDLPGGGDSAVGSDSADGSDSAGGGATDPAATPLAVAPCAQAGAATAPAQAGAAAWPDFDWRTVPVWLRVRKSTAYTPDELKQIAGFPLVVFEKANGHRTSGDVESGTLAAGRAVKQINPRTKVIFYFNAVIRYGDYKANAEFDRRSDAWALRKGGAVFTFKDRYRLFDLTRPDVRAWWIATARGMAAHDQIDGLFIDAICKTTTHGQAYSQGYRRMAADLRAGWPAGKLLLGNAVRAGEDGCNLDHLDYLDGSYVERWGVPVGGESYEDYVARGIEAMRKTVERGKLLLFSAGPDAFGPRTSTPPAPQAMREWMRGHIDYPLGVFLIVAGQRSYFEWTDGPDALQGALEHHDYPEYHKPLGRPLGPPARDGFVYTRRFEHLDVRVDIRNKTARLQWR